MSRRSFFKATKLSIRKRVLNLLLVWLHAIVSDWLGLAMCDTQQTNCYRLINDRSAQNLIPTFLFPTSCGISISIWSSKELEAVETSRHSLICSFFICRVKQRTFRCLYKRFETLRCLGLLLGSYFNKSEIERAATLFVAVAPSKWTCWRIKTQLVSHPKPISKQIEIVLIAQKSQKIKLMTPGEFCAGHKKSLNS